MTIETKPSIRRNLLIVGLGFLFLIAMTFLGTTLESLIPQAPTQQTQVAQTNLYSVTLQVTPNPPRITQPATLLLRIQQRTTHASLSNAHVTLESSMAAMEMGTEHIETQTQPGGSYQAQIRFSMNGRWQIRVIIAQQGAGVEECLFTITAQ